MASECNNFDVCFTKLSKFFKQLHHIIAPAYLNLNCWLCQLYYGYQVYSSFALWNTFFIIAERTRNWLTAKQVQDEYTEKEISQNLCCNLTSIQIAIKFRCEISCSKEFIFNAANVSRLVQIKMNAKTCKHVSNANRKIGNSFVCSA